MASNQKAGHARGKREEEPEESPTEKAHEEAEARREELDIDDILDEIDEVLEVNAAEFVRSYVQKGGE